MLNVPQEPIGVQLQSTPAPLSLVVVAAIVAVALTCMVAGGGMLIAIVGGVVVVLLPLLQAEATSAMPTVKAIRRSLRFIAHLRWWG